MSISAFDKMLTELERCGWKYTAVNQPLWVSDGSVKYTEYRNKKKENELKETKVEYLITKSNFKGYTFWIQKPGKVLRMTRPVTNINVIGNVEQVAEFNEEGAFIRGNQYTTETYIPGKRLMHSVGDSFKELMLRVQVTSPENLEKVKDWKIQQAKEKLEKALAKKAEYETNIKDTKEAVMKLIEEKDKPFSFMDVYEDIIQTGLLVFPFQKEYREQEIEEAKKELEGSQI
jgi:hypothetical protein